VSRLRVVPIVEGHGEYQCIRILIERIWLELLAGDFVEVLRPIRQHRHKLVKPEELTKAIRLALSKLANSPASNDPGLVLVLIDADDEPACQLGPRLLEIARSEYAQADVSCVVAVVEYETWFVAAAESLGTYLDLGGAVPPNDPEKNHLGKSWIERHFRGAKYSETQDQPAMTRMMDLVLCRQRSPSFDKLCREFDRRRSPTGV
jgi:hypothetical protein